MKRRRWWLLSGLVAILAIAGAVWWGVVMDSPSAEDAAEGYLRALESGDPEAVVATGAPVSETALTAFAGATSTLEGAEVTGVRDRDGDTTATVSFRLDGADYEGRLTLTRESGRWAGDDSGLGALTVTTTIGSGVRVGESVVPAAEEIALLPAVYPVAAAPATLLTGAAEVVVLPGGSAAAKVTAELRPAATDAAQAQLEDYLQTCTAGGSEVPENCGIRIPWGTELREVSDVAFRVERYPAVALDPVAFTAHDGILEATVTGVGHDGQARTVTYRNTAWSVRGTVEVGTDELALTVW